MLDFLHKERYSFDDLIDIMALLRSENGCPWDKEQTHDSIKSNLIEEAYEALDAIQDNDIPHMREELGDLLLQVVFHCQMEHENGNFDMYDVCDSLCKKLIRRHPHIFGDASAENSDEVLNLWESVKKQENNRSASDFVNDVCKALPALMQSQKVQSRIAKENLSRCKDIYDAMSCADEQLYELQEVIDQDFWDEELISEKLGELLLACTEISRLADIDSEFALKKATSNLQKHFKAVSELAKEKYPDAKNIDNIQCAELWEQTNK